MCRQIQNPTSPYHPRAPSLGRAHSSLAGLHGTQGCCQNVNETRGPSVPNPSVVARLIHRKPSVLRGQKPRAGGCGELSSSVCGLAAGGFVSNLGICPVPCAHPYLCENPLNEPKPRSLEQKEIHCFRPRRCYFGKKLVSGRGHKSQLVGLLWTVRGPAVSTLIRGWSAARQCRPPTESGAQGSTGCAASALSLFGLVCFTGFF